MEWNTLRKLVRHEGGQVFILVLILLVVGSLILVPVLSFTGTSLISGQTYEDKVTDYYSADSGVEDALWQIKYDHLEDFGLFTTSYDTYGFDILGSSFDYQAPLGVNGRSVNVNIANVWIPKDIDPSANDLRTMAESAKLVVTGTATGPNSYRVNLSYNRDLNDPALTVSSLGIWLPPGFSYDRDDGDTCSLENNPLGPYRPTLPPEVTEHAGGTAVIWYFPSDPIFVNFPGVVTTANTYKLDINLTYHSSVSGRKPDAVAWMNTSGVSDTPFAWDADVRIFRITSIAAGGTEIEAYAVKTELRKLARTIPGDYKAIGNSLLADDNYDSNHIRDTWHTPSDAVASGIPQDAEVAAAYLYWSGWKQGSPSTITGTSIAPLNPDDCNDFAYWTASNSAWTCDGSVFLGHYLGGGDPARYLTLTNGLPLGDFTSAAISWRQSENGTLESTDGLQYQISNNGGGTWSGMYTAFTNDIAASTFSFTIPGGYYTDDFKIRFYLYGFADADDGNCSIDDFGITVFSDTSADTSKWTEGDYWDPVSGAWRFDYGGSGGDQYRRLTLGSNLNLSAFSNPAVVVSWRHGEAGGLEPDDMLRFQVSSNGGSTYSSLITAFSNNQPANYPTLYPYSYTVPASYLTSGFRIRFYAQVFEGSDEYCYIDDIVVTVFNDDCSTLDNWTLTSTAWSCDQVNDWFVGHYSGADNSARYLPLTSSMNLSAYAAQQVFASWDQWRAGTLEAGDALFVSFSGNGGTSWSDNDVGTNGYLAAADDVQAGGFAASAESFSIQIPVDYLTAGFKMRFYVAGFAESGEYCYVDNIRVRAWPAAFRDEGSFAPPESLSNWSSNGAWTSYYNSGFIGHAAGNGLITLSSPLDLSALASRIAIVQWKQAESGALESSDILRYQFSGDGGATWSLLETGVAFENDLGSDHAFYDFDGDGDGVPGIIIPTEYLTVSFKMRFYVEGFAESGEYCYVDDIMIYGTPLVADTTAFLRIDGQQVYFDEDGIPRQGAQDLTADRSQVLINNGSGSPPAYYGYGYSCYKDVTVLVRAFTPEGANGNHTGNATYTVGGVDATDDYQLSYAGWSLIIIYTSMATQGHLLYVYDDFTFAPDNTNIDFDKDGTPGGAITGFIVPDRITGEVYSAQLTCFIGEGDEFILDDYIRLNGSKLWDGINCDGNSEAGPNNVWNSLSTGLSFDGVDVDTFRIRWDSLLLEPGDIAAQLDMYTGNDNWNLIYLIISFRSETTVGGTITYLIK